VANRWLCDVVDEMRQCLKTLRFDIMPGLVEEVQSIGNRMEAAIRDEKEFDTLKDEIHDLKIQKRRLERQVKNLEDVKEELKE